MITITIILSLSNIYAENNTTNSINTPIINDTQDLSNNNPYTKDSSYDSKYSIEENEANNYPEVHLDDNLRYFDEYEYENNTIFIIDEDLHNKEINIYDMSFSFTSFNNITLYNSQIYVMDYAQIHIYNLTFKSDDSSKFNIPLYLETDNNIVENVTFIDSRYNYNDKYNQVRAEYDNNTIKNCNFYIEYPAMNSNWNEYGEPMRSTVIFVKGDYNKILNNTLHVQEVSPQMLFGSIVAIGSFGNHNLIDRNNISMISTLYAYAITIYFHNNTITNNDIYIYSNRYGAGISLNGETSNNTVRNNSINIEVVHDDEHYTGIIEAAYGIVITEIAYTGSKYKHEKSKTVNNIIEGNTITGKSTHFWGFEQFGGTNTTIRNNNIDIEGTSVMAVAAIGYNTTVTGNNLIVRGEHNNTEHTPDYLRIRTTGILILHSDNTIIDDNYIESLNGPGITSEYSDGLLISGNLLNIINNDIVIQSLIENNDVTILNNLIQDYINHYINTNNALILNNTDYEEYINSLKNTQNNTNSSDITNKTNSTDDNNHNKTEEKLNNTVPDDIIDTNKTDDTNDTTDIDTNETNTNSTNTDELNDTIIIDEPIIDVNQTNINQTSENNHTEENNNQTIDTNETKPEEPKNETEINQTENNNHTTDDNNKTKDEQPKESNQTIPSDSINKTENINQTELKPEKETNQTITEEPKNETGNNNHTINDNPDNNQTINQTIEHNNTIDIPVIINQTEPINYNNTENITQTNQTEVNNTIIPEEVNNTPTDILQPSEENKTDKPNQEKNNQTEKPNQTPQNNNKTQQNEVINNTTTEDKPKEIPENINQNITEISEDKQIYNQTETVIVNNTTSTGDKENIDNTETIKPNTPMISDNQEDTSNDDSDEVNPEAQEENDDTSQKSSNAGVSNIVIYENRENSRDTSQSSSAGNNPSNPVQVYKITKKTHKTQDKEDVFKYTIVLLVSTIFLLAYGYLKGSIT